MVEGAIKKIKKMIFIVCTRCGEFGVLQLNIVNLKNNINNLIYEFKPFNILHNIV